MNRHSLHYRADIDGLRGIAVLAVVLYHAFPSIVPSGFIGVDVFFVVSGFLITSILVSHLEEGSFSLWRFYANRIRRIFPALLVVLACTLALGIGLLLPEEFRRLSRHLAGAATFVSNFLLWQESGYFDAEVETKPLLHLWSLAIEEQYYLAWPLILWLTWRRRPLFITIVLIGFSGSLFLNVTQISTDPAGAFYSPLTRCWELMLGAALAAASQWLQPPRQAAGRWTMLLAIAALGAIGLAAFGIAPGSPYPGWRALVPTLATLAIIAMPQTWLHREVLASRALVSVGLISYPIYLWHWPLLSIAHISGRDDGTVRIAIVGASFLLAWLTYRLVERPIRFGPGFRQTKALALVSVIALLGIAGVLGIQGTLRPLLGDDKLADFERERKWTYIDAQEFRPVAFGDADFPNAGNLRRHLEANSGSGLLFLREIRSSQSTKTLYIGDSQMEQMWARVGHRIREAPAKTRSAVFLTASGFLPIPGTHYERAATSPHFAGLADTMLEYALSDPTIDTVVIGAMWRVYFRDGDVRGWRRPDSPFYVLVNGKPEHLMAGRRANEIALETLGRMMQTLRKAGKRVFLMQEVPAQGQLRIRRSWGDYELTPSAEPKETWLRMNAHLRGELARVAAQSGAQVIDPFPSLCPRDRCETSYEGHHPVYMDASHLTDRYVRKYGTFMDSTIDLLP